MQIYKPQWYHSHMYKLANIAWIGFPHMCTYQKGLTEDKANSLAEYDLLLVHSCSALLLYQHCGFHSLFDLTSRNLIICSTFAQLYGVRPILLIPAISAISHYIHCLVCRWLCDRGCRIRCSRG